MLNYFDKKELYEPVIVDNRSDRDEIPEINQYFEAIQKETEKFPKVDGVIVKEKLVDQIGCPICTTKKYHQLFVKQGFIFAECTVCEQVYVKNRLKKDILLNNYSN